MSKQQPKDTQTGRIEISEKRQVKKKQPDFFARTSLPQLEDSLHPIEQIERDSESKKNILKFGSPNTENTDIQRSEPLDIRKNAPLDSQDVAGMDIQGPVIADIHLSTGNENTDSNISKTTPRISKEQNTTDSNISKKLDLDIQTEEQKGKWSKYDHKRRGKGVFLRTNDSITKEFKKFCVDNDWDFSYGTEIAWSNLMKNLDIQNKSNLAIKIAHDDRRLMKLWKTTPTIINLYLAYNPKNKWTVRDDEAASKLNDTDSRLIELGILQTLGNRGFKGRINSFSYYVPEIETWIETNLPEESLESVLKVLRIKWQSINKSREEK